MHRIESNRIGVSFLFFSVLLLWLLLACLSRSHRSIPHSALHCSVRQPQESLPGDCSSLGSDSGWFAPAGPLPVTARWSHAAGRICAGGLAILTDRHASSATPPARHETSESHTEWHYRSQIVLRAHFPRHMCSQTATPRKSTSSIEGKNKEIQPRVLFLRRHFRFLKFTTSYCCPFKMSKYQLNLLLF